MRDEIPRKVLRIAEDIKLMKIRGAGRIARAAATALKVAALEYPGSAIPEGFIEYMKRVGEVLKSTRPTAVSLPNAVGYVMVRLEQAAREGSTLDELKAIAVGSAEEFIDMSERAVEVIGRIGSKRIRDGDTVLTHCNSSAALSVLKHAHLEGKNISVYATETRPKFQGYITYRVLKSCGIDVVLIPDSASRYFMKDVDKVFVGADAIAANGAVVNKVGTSLIALAAHEARVNVFVAAESYKFSPSTVLGELIVIEERSPLEVVPKEFLERHGNIAVRNPAFDVTPPEYIDAIITEKGVIPPKAALAVLMEEYGRVIAESLMSMSLEEDVEFVY